MLRIVMELMGLLCVPVLLLIAFRGWINSIRAELPRWRNGVCLSAFVLLSLNWIGAAMLETSAVIFPHVPRSTRLMEVLLMLSHPLAILVVLLALALRRLPRIEAIAAALLLLLSWPIGYV